MESFIVIFVQDSQTGHVEHWEVFEGTGLPANDLVTKICMRVDELNAQFGLDCYEASYKGFNSLEAMHHVHPELGSLDSLRALIRPM